MPDYAGAFGDMTLLDDQITTTNTSSVFAPGQIFYWRGGSNRGNTALVKWVQLDNNGCSQGEALISDLATVTAYGVAKSTTTVGFNRLFRGVSAATIASNSFGFMIISGYVEKMDFSQTVASGEMVTMSGSVAGKLTAHFSSSIMNATIGTVSQSTITEAVAVARVAVATGVGSAHLIGCWG